jgi:hypothetical protein
VSKKNCCIPAAVIYDEIGELEPGEADSRFMNKD